MRAAAALPAAMLLGLSTLLASAAQLVFRYVMQNHEMISMGLADGLSTMLQSATVGDALLLIAGIVLYAISMIVWILVLSRFDVSFAYPMMSISYIMVFLLAVSLPMFNESVSVWKIVAVLFVVTGVVFLSFEGDQRPLGDATAGAARRQADRSA